jgi:hypothetical protein
MDDADFETWLTAELVPLPGVLAVALGGSRVQGTHRPDSDWDFALYYRGEFDPGCLRAKDWPGRVSDVAGWAAVSGGAWLTLDSRRVGIHYRDLDNVEHWCAEATAGRFKKELLFSYAAGIPVYVVGGELAVITGSLPGSCPVRFIQQPWHQKPDVAGALTRCSVSAMPHCRRSWDRSGRGHGLRFPETHRGRPIRLGLPTSVDAQREGHCRSRRPCRLCGPPTAGPRRSLAWRCAY